MILILCPSEVKMTKTALETGRTFSTLFADMSLRHDLLEASSVGEFKAHIQRVAHELAALQGSYAAGIGALMSYLCFCTAMHPP